MLTDRLKQFKNILRDFPSSLVVFFVAVPLCMGIALLSGAPLFAGLISGVLGGIVAGSLSGSPISVTGPAAGMASIVLLTIKDLGTYEAFLTVVVLAGVLQIILGYVKAGVVGHFFPSAVIRGMLAGIGIIFILKQIPHAFGDDADYVGDDNFFQDDKHNTFTEIYQAVINLLPSAVLISGACMLVFFLCSASRFRNNKWLSVIPAPLLAVCAGILLNHLISITFPGYALSNDHLVNLPDTNSLSSLFTQPDWSVLTNQRVYFFSIILALVASVETLLSIEAADKMDTFKRITPVNRELKAQGVTNVLCGLLGGLPVTAVIVRTSANVTAGAKTKASTIMHAIILALTVLAFPFALEKIPLASIASILIIYGYRLTAPSLWREMWKKGKNQFLPFVATALCIVFSNLLIGVFIGILVSIFFVLKTNFRTAILLVSDETNYILKFTKDVSFLNKSSLRKALEEIPMNASLIIDGSNAQFIDQDIIATLEDFVVSAPIKNISVELKKSNRALNVYFRNEEKIQP